MSRSGLALLLLLPLGGCSLVVGSATSRLADDTTSRPCATGLRHIS
jgi:hypothetical protein